MPRACALRDHRLSSTAALVAAVALLAGCGSYSKHDFVASANAICASTVRATRAISPPASQDLSALAPYLAKLVPILQSEEKQMHALQRPSGSGADGATLSRYLGALTQSAVDFKALATAASAGNKQAVASAEAALRANPVTSLATSYGLRSCGTPGATVG